MKSPFFTKRAEGTQNVGLSTQCHLVSHLRRRWRKETQLLPLAESPGLGGKMPNDSEPPTGSCLSWPDCDQHRLRGPPTPQGAKQEEPKWCLPHAHCRSVQLGRQVTDGRSGTGWAMPVPPFSGTVEFTVPPTQSPEKKNGKPQLGSLSYMDTCIHIPSLSQSSRT